jgi:hypothetical protein
MAINDTRTIVIDSYHVSNGGLSSFCIAVPPDLIKKTPVSIKLLNYDFVNITHAFNSGRRYLDVIATDQNGSANNHLQIIAGTDIIDKFGNPNPYIDIYLPHCPIDVSAWVSVLPASQTSGIGPAALVTNSDIAKLLQDFINEFTQPAMPIGLGLTFTINWMDVTGIADIFEIMCNNLYTIRFNINDSIGWLLGFGNTQYTGTNQLINYAISSPFYVRHFNNYSVDSQDVVIFVISDLAFGTQDGTKILGATLDDSGILFAIDPNFEYYQNFSEKINAPFINIRQSRFAELISSKTAVYLPCQQETTFGSTIHFWLKQINGLPIPNYHIYNWTMNLSISFTEVDSPSARLS